MNESSDKRLGPILFGDPCAQHALHIPLPQPWLGAVEIALQVIPYYPLM